MPIGPQQVAASAVTKVHPPEILATHWLLEKAQLEYVLQRCFDRSPDAHLEVEVAMAQVAREG